jgi:hypothetical protein
MKGCRKPVASRGLPIKTTSKLSLMAKCCRVVACRGIILPLGTAFLHGSHNSMMPGDLLNLLQVLGSCLRNGGWAFVSHLLPSPSKRIQDQNLFQILLPQNQKDCSEADSNCRQCSIVVRTTMHHPNQLDDPSWLMSATWKIEHMTPRCVRCETHNTGSTASVPLNVLNTEYMTRTSLPVMSWREAST